jgi:hypothetical protein
MTIFSQKSWSDFTIFLELLSSPNRAVLTIRVKSVDIISTLTAGRCYKGYRWHPTYAFSRPDYLTEPCKPLTSND